MSIAVSWLDLTASSRYYQSSRSIAGLFKTRVKTRESGGMGPPNPGPYPLRPDPAPTRGLLKTSSASSDPRCRETCQARQNVRCQGCRARVYNLVVWCQSRHVKAKFLSVKERKRAPSPDIFASDPSTALAIQFVG